MTKRNTESRPGNTFPNISLKVLNSPYIGLFLFVNVVLFWVKITNGNFYEINWAQLWSKVSYKNGFEALALSLASFIITGLPNSKLKERLAFWRLTNVLPGHRSFSLLVNDDPRIDIDALKRKLGSFPTEPKEQNRLWYKIYRLHQDKIRVASSHRRYLLARDMTAISFVVLVAGLAHYFWGHYEWIHYQYGWYLVIQFLVTSLVARNEGNRFVCNVLVEESIN